MIRVKNIQMILLNVLFFVGDLAANFTDYMFQKTFRANYASINGVKAVIDREIWHITGQSIS